MTNGLVQHIAMEKSASIQGVKGPDQKPYSAAIDLGLYYIPINDIPLNCMFSGHLIQKTISNWARLFKASLA